MRIQIVKNPYEHLGVTYMSEMTLGVILDNVTEDRAFARENKQPYRIGTGLFFVPYELLGITNYPKEEDSAWAVFDDREVKIIECNILTEFQYAKAKIDVLLFKQELMLRNRNWNMKRMQEKLNRTNFIC